MELNNILKDYTLKSQIFHFKGNAYNYIEAVYTYKGVQCMKYYILDFTQDIKYKEINWKDRTVFQEFQALLLEDDFFHSPGDTRFNLYLVFIVNKDDELLHNIDIQQNFTYARKIILAENEVKNFFVESLFLKRENSNSSLEVTDSKQIMKQLYSSKEEARSIFETISAIWVTTCRLLGIKIEKKFNEISPALQLLDTLDEMIPRKTVELKKNIRNKQRKNDHEEYNIQQISDAKINNFRKYQRMYNIPFKRVNLFFGDNGTGKTSLLEAIELGITGDNRKFDNEKKSEDGIVIRCKTSQNEPFEFSAKKNSYRLAKAWYGTDATNIEDFNRFFTQYNYFDTSWASVFAIEGECKVNINQLKEFLNIDDMETCKVLLHRLYENLNKIAVENKKRINMLKAMKKIKVNPLDKFLKYYSDENIPVLLDKMRGDNSNAISDCEKQIEKLREIEIITLDNILSTHISKMKRVFKLLICSNEYSDLQLNAEEIVAIRSMNMKKDEEEMVSMSQMSTGQKVCLALSFMFSLFLSNENAPNIIMLDEPVANLDDLHMLNLLDVLRRFAMAGTQIFFTTSNPNVAKLFRRKFSYLGEDFGFYRVSELEDKVRITYEQYDMTKEEPVKKEEL